MKSICNFHTHTHLCNHAKGVPLDYARQALKEGCTALGFSDHCPYPESFFDIWPHIRMAQKDVQIYLDEIQAAREEMPFPVLTGFECEWDSAVASWYTDGLKGQYKADFLVYGPHWVTDGSTHIYVRNITDAKVLNKYVDQLIDGMATGIFSFVAHPDLFLCAPSFTEWDEQTKACSKAIIDAAKDLKLPLEINGLGMSRPASDTRRGMRYAYPYVEFWELAADAGIPVFCNSDAHDPNDVLFNAWKARDFAARFGFKVLETL